MVIDYFQEGYDVVHTYTATPGFLGRLAARLVGTPVILNHQAGWTVTEFSPKKERILYTPLEYLASLASSKAICVSHAVKEQARRLHIAPPGKLFVICNGIEPEPFITATNDNSRKTLRQKWGYSDHHVLIGNTGRLSPQKDNDSLVEAMIHLKTLMPDVPFSLLLAGEGPEREKLGKLVESLKLGEQVRLLGFVKDIPGASTNTASAADRARGVPEMTENLSFLQVVSRRNRPGIGQRFGKTPPSVAGGSRGWYASHRSADGRHDGLFGGNPPRP